MSSQVTSFFELIADASIFNSAFDNAKAKAAEFGAQWQKTAVQVAASSDQVQASTAKVGKSAPQSLNVIGLQAAAYGLLALAGAAAGVLAITERMVSSYAQFSQQILLNSEALGMNTADLQTWEKIASVVGIDQQALVTGFERFVKNLEDGAPALKAAGLNLKDLGITTTDVGTAVLQLADYFHTHTDAAQKAAIAMALFGRSGAEMIPILDQGSIAVQNYKAQLEAMGVILSDTQLFAGAQAQSAITGLTTAFDVAKSELVGAALPGFTAFFNTLAIILKANGNLWVEIGQTINNVVMFITALMAGMAGIDLATALTPPPDAAAAYQGLGAGAQDAASGMDAATQSAQGTTAALDAQIAALQELQRQYNDTADTQIAALQDQKRASDDELSLEIAAAQQKQALYDDVANAQKAAIQDQKRAYDELADSEKAALQAQLDTLHDVNDGRRRAGEDIISYERRLQELKLTDQIRGIDTAKTQYDRSADDQIAAIDKEKAAYDELVAKWVATLQQEKTASDRALADKLAALQQEKAAYDRGLADHIAVLEREKAAVKSASGAMAADLVAGMNTGMVGLNQSLAAGMTKAQKAFLDSVHQMGKDLADLFSGNTKQMDAAASKLGSEIGQSLWNGLVGALTADVSGHGGTYNGVWGTSVTPGGPVDRLITWLWNVDNPHPIGSVAAGHAAGTISTTEHLAMISEGNSAEAVLPLSNPTRSLALMEQSGLADLARSSPGGGPSAGLGGGLVVNVHGITNPMLIAAEAARLIESEMRKRGFSLSRGFG